MFQKHEFTLKALNKNQYEWLKNELSQKEPY